MVSPCATVATRVPWLSKTTAVAGTRQRVPEGAIWNVHVHEHSRQQPAGPVGDVDLGQQRSRAWIERARRARHGRGDGLVEMSADHHLRRQARPHVWREDLWNVHEHAEPVDLRHLEQPVRRPGDDSSAPPPCCRWDSQP